MNLMSTADEAALVLAYIEFLEDKEEYCAIKAIKNYMVAHEYESMQRMSVPFRLAELLHKQYVGDMGYSRDMLLELMHS